jgi:hypothetical protein
MMPGPPLRVLPDRFYEARDRAIAGTGGGMMLDDRLAPGCRGPGLRVAARRRRLEVGWEDAESVESPSQRGNYAEVPLVGGEDLIGVVTFS